MRPTGPQKNRRTAGGGHDSGWQGSLTYEDTGLSDVTQYTYRAKIRDKSSNNNETGYSPEASATTTADTTPPSPDSMTWGQVPTQTGAYTITMTATTAADEGLVEYYFECTAGGGHNSEWQGSPTYEDSGLLPLTQYTYKVKARDKSAAQNETGFSGEASATTVTDMVPPTPDPMTWESEPTMTGISSLIMTATTATDGADVEYYFHCLTEGGHDSVWQDSTTYEDTGLESNNEYSYQVKARDKSPAQNETAYSEAASGITDTAIQPVVEQEVYVSLAAEDGRLYSKDGGATGYYAVSGDDTSISLRLGDYWWSSAQPEPVEVTYRTVVSFDTSFLPEDCQVTSATLELTCGYASGTDPNEWAGQCLVDIANPNFGTGPELYKTDWEAMASAVAVSSFPTLANIGETMVSTEFNQDGMDNINPDGKTQFRIYFEIPTNNNLATDYMGFYPGENEFLDNRPKLKITYITQTPKVELYSTGDEDGRVWNKNGTTYGRGYDSNDEGDAALRLGDFSGTEGYRSIVSFDLTTLPEDAVITAAKLVLFRGANVGDNPFDMSNTETKDGWAGDCFIDVVSPYFGVSQLLVTSDFQAVADAVTVASFLEDPGEERPMESTNFSPEGMAAIVRSAGKTQFKIYFTTYSDNDAETDYLGFYAGEETLDVAKKPKLVVRYSD